MSISDETQINGPINVLRMEGDVFGIKKVIYIFMDYHLPIDHQTRCPNFTSLDIYQYLAINLKKSDHPIDFMFEITEEYIGKESYKYKEIYIKEVTDFFKSEFSKNKSKSNNLVRYHYVDVRDYLFDTINQYDNTLENIMDNVYANSYWGKYVFDNILLNLEGIVEELNYWDSLLFGDLRSIPKRTSSNLKRLSEDTNINENVKKNIKKVPKFILKIRERYKNKKVHDNFKLMFDYIKKLIKETLQICFDMVNEITKQGSSSNVGTLTYSKCLGTYFWGDVFCDRIDIVMNLRKKHQELSWKMLLLFSKMMDIFFLRRFLDKDYITHAIIYTGGAHSITYVQHLITKYNFKITHASYSAEKNLSKLNTYLAKFLDPSDVIEYEKMLYPHLLVQCSDLSHFPKNFS